LFSCGGCGCGNGCCEASCGCEPSCGCNNGCCGCGSGSPAATTPAAPVEAGARLMPVPPRPIADPNASVSRPRSVVRASFLR
jgi:hypothetical protein